MVSGADVSFGDDYAHIAYFKYDYSMSVIVHPQDISRFYIRKCEPARSVHPARQAAECRVAEYESESYAAHGGDILPVQGSAFPMVISLGVRIGLIVGPRRSLFICVLVFQRDHSRIGFRRGRDCAIRSSL